MTAQAEAPAEKGQEKKVEKSGWSKPIARPGEELFLAARLVGYMPGTLVTFRIFPSSGEPGAPIATLRAATGDGGIAFKEWVYVHDPVRVKDPRLIFEASVEGEKALSPVLTIVDQIDLDLRDEKGAPVEKKEVRLVDSLGYLHVVETAADGRASFDKVACGDCMFTVRGWQILGESKPGEKKFRSGTRHAVTMREMKFTVEFDAPRDGDVFLAGDRLPLKVKVLRMGQPWEGEPQISANNGARITGVAKGAKGQSTAQPMLVLPANKEGEVEVTAKYESATATVKLKVVRPYVAELVLDGPDAFPLFDWKKGAPAPARFAFKPNGDAADSHAGAFRFGKKLRGKARLASGEQLTKAARIEVAISTPPLDDTGLATKGFEKHAGKPLTLRLPEGKRADGAEFLGGEDGVWVEIESDRPLPNAVASYDWSLEVRLNQKLAAGWAVSDANLPIWPKVGEIRGVRANAIFNQPQAGDGKALDPNAMPLKKSELDPFHVRLACTWAKGGANLLMADERSIPAKLARSVRHLNWPAEYDGLRGKKAADHPKPQNIERLAGDAIHPGGGKACGACGGIIEGGACSKCGKLVPAGRRHAGTKAEIAKGAESRETASWAAGEKSSKCNSCGKLMPGRTPRAKDGSMLCPHCKRRVSPLEAKCPACEKWVDERDLATGKHACEQGDATAERPDPTGKNWGWSVITNPTHPGGRAHQQASLLAAALGTLGVKATILYLRPRPGGGVNLLEHDPMTRLSDAYDPGRDWGRPLLAFAGVPVDKSRDKDFEGVKIHEDDTFVIEPLSKKAGLHKDAATPAHELKKPNLEKPGAECRNGHPLAAGGEPIRYRRVPFVDNTLGPAQVLRTRLTGSEARVATLAVVHPWTDPHGSRDERLVVWWAMQFTDMVRYDVDRRVFFITGKDDSTWDVATIGDVQPAFDPGGKWDPVLNVINQAVQRELAKPPELRKSAGPSAERCCRVCGAQPRWTYECAKCGKPVPASAKGKHDCGAPLEGLFCEAIVYACPNCKRTVHDGDSECWACSAKLAARKPDERFGQPKAGTASGGKKLDDGSAPAEETPPKGKLIGLWIPANSQDAGCAPLAHSTYHLDGKVDVNRGIGWLVNPNPGGTPGNFGMHDHQYQSPHVPRPDRAVVTYHFHGPATVGEIEIDEHTNGITQIEGFVGDSEGSLGSVGRVTGSLGDRTGSSVLGEHTTNIFKFNNARPGTFFRFVITKTSLHNGWAFYRAFPRDASGKRIEMGEGPAAGPPPAPPKPGKLIGLWIPGGSMDAGCAPVAHAAYHFDGKVDINRGIGWLVNPNPGGTPGHFGMHDHRYQSHHVPRPDRAVVTYHFDGPTAVGEIEVDEHGNGVTDIEGLVGDSEGSLASIGRVTGSLGQRGFAEHEANIFRFASARAGTYFRFVVTRTSLHDGWAFYRAFPRDAQGKRIEVLR